MKEITKTFFVCEFCGLEHEDKNFMTTHETCCIENPINQPCSKCANHIVGFGCRANMDMDAVGGKVLCFKYIKGEPYLPPAFLTNFIDAFSTSNIIDGNTSGDNNDDSED